MRARLRKHATARLSSRSLVSNNCSRRAINIRVEDRTSLFSHARLNLRAISPEEFKLLLDHARAHIRTYYVYVSDYYYYYILLYVC